jgi:hypothetical protein
MEVIEKSFLSAMKPTLQATAPTGEFWRHAVLRKQPFHDASLLYHPVKKSCNKSQGTGEKAS